MKKHPAVETMPKLNVQVKHRSLTCLREEQVETTTYSMLTCPTHTHTNLIFYLLLAPCSTLRSLFRLQLFSYVASENPSNVMKLMEVYAPMWFTIKCNSSLKNGAQNVFEMIESLREMDQAVQDIVLPVIQWNACFAHPENILLAMINDEWNNIEELTWRHIKQA
uniref:Uncharacterized protein n=1 Tax=Octopus bimaculoides TaxID=37653 RepID=A0A0L8HGS2_OCTBM